MMKRKFKPEWRKRVPATCARCNGGFSAVEAEIRRGRGRYCSLACAAATAAVDRNQKGPANNNWRGGLSDNAERKRRYRIANPEKHAAHLQMRTAIRRGDLIRAPCERCGDTQVEGHHDNYERPLEVKWLCKRHHLEAHGGRLDNHL